MEKLLFLHGALGSKASMALLANKLSEKYVVKTLEFSGHGETPLNSHKFGMHLFADEIRDFIDNNHFSGCHIFAYSMGGYAALYSEFLYPGKIKTIFTLGTKFMWTEEYSEKEIKKLNAEKIEEKVPQFAARLIEMHIADGWKSLLKRTADMMLQLGKSNLLQKNQLERIKIPVCIAVGDEDNTVSAEESLAISQIIPQGYFALLQNTPHPLDLVPLNTIEEKFNEFIQKNF